MKTASIILAAGSSTRMGRSKQMLDIRGVPLLVKTVKTFLDADISPVLVVLGCNAAAHRELIAHLPIEIVENSFWKRGLGSSIKAGLLHLTSNHPSIASVIISVCDQPMLSKEVILDLVKKSHDTGKHIIASRYAGVEGVPAFFHRKYFAALANLADDQGAKKIIVQHMPDVSVVHFGGGEIDLDTMEDYHAFPGK